MLTLRDMDPAGKHVLDIAAPVLVAASFADWLPPIAALLSAVWIIARLYEYVRWVRRGRVPEEKP